MLENTQIRATKIGDGVKNMTYGKLKIKNDRFSNTAVPQVTGDMIQVLNHFHTDEKSTLSPNFRLLPRTNRKLSFQLTPNLPKGGTHGCQLNSFYFCVSNKWNLLPHKVLKIENIDTFKSRLDAAWVT